jgi:hypothetical protein
MDAPDGIRRLPDGKALPSASKSAAAGTSLCRPTAYDRAIGTVGTAAPSLLKPNDLSRFVVSATWLDYAGVRSCDTMARMGKWFEYMCGVQKGLAA